MVLQLLFPWVLPIYTYVVITTVAVEVWYGFDRFETADSALINYCCLKLINWQHCYWGLIDRRQYSSNISEYDISFVVHYWSNSLKWCAVLWTNISHKAEFLSKLIEQNSI